MSTTFQAEVHISMQETVAKLKFVRKNFEEPIDEYYVDFLKFTCRKWPTCLDLGDQMNRCKILEQHIDMPEVILLGSVQRMLPTYALESLAMISLFKEHTIKQTVAIKQELLEEKEEPEISDSTVEMAFEQHLRPKIENGIDRLVATITDETLYDSVGKLRQMVSFVPTNSSLSNKALEIVSSSKEPMIKEAVVIKQDNLVEEEEPETNESSVKMVVVPHLASLKYNEDLHTLTNKNANVFNRYQLHQRAGDVIPVEISIPKGTKRGEELPNPLQRLIQSIQKKESY